VNCPCGICMCELKSAKFMPCALKSYSDMFESIEPARVLSRESENVAEVGNECESPGGVSEPGVMTWVIVVVVEVVPFSESFLRLMIFLMFSFWFLRSSLLLHHIGLLYSQRSPRCLQAVQDGVPSSHFFLRRRQV